MHIVCSECTMLDVNAIDAEVMLPQLTIQNDVCSYLFQQKD